MRMSRTVIGSLFAAASIVTASVAVQAEEPGGTVIQVNMTGAAEAPGPGDPDGTGTAKFTIRQEKGQICYNLTVQNIGPATAAHIHLAPVGQPGPVVVPLKAPTKGSSEACTTVTRELATAILKNPANYYVNVHNAEFPAGAVRGQLG